MKNKDVKFDLQRALADEALVEAYANMQSPIQHIPTELGINQLKREIKALGLPRKTANKLIKAYKRRVWMEQQAIARGRGTFPVHKKFGKKIEVKYEEKEETVDVTRK